MVHRCPFFLRPRASQAIINIIGKENFDESNHDRSSDRGSLYGGGNGDGSNHERTGQRQASERRLGPSQWGADDKAGSANHTKNPANIKRALATVKQFKSVTIGKMYQKEIPAFGPRVWNLVIPGTPTGGPFGKNALTYHDEFVTTEIGQIGTQFDGPGHIGVNTSKGIFMYNGRMAFDSYERGAGGRVLGMGPLGVEHVAEFGFVCRMVILDAAAYNRQEEARCLYPRS